MAAFQHALTLRQGWVRDIYIQDRDIGLTS